jgi:hypothetical protein
MGIIYRMLWNGAQALRMVGEGQRIIRDANAKKPSRTEIINTLISERGYVSYLEIGVRNPDDNFNRIACARKASVDPGLEFRANPVDFVMTSDAFFAHWAAEHPGSTFDVIFIDGLHRAEQCWRDIENALGILSPGGVVVVHDVLPPAHRFAREDFNRDLLADTLWNGTTWKAFHRYQWEGQWEARIVDTDWGVGLIDSSQPHLPETHGNPFYEWDAFERFVAQSGRVVSWDSARVWLGFRTN